MDKRSKSYKHWIVLVCLSLMFASHAGIINNSIGVFYSPVSDELGFLRGSFATNETIKMIAAGLVGLQVPKLIDKFGWKKVIIYGTIFSFIGTAGMAFTENLYVFYVLGGIRGVGTSMAGMIPFVLLTNNWFQEKNGFAIGIASAFSGLVGMVSAPLLSGLVDSLGWRTSFIIMGASVVVLNIPAMFYKYQAEPEQVGLLPYGFKEEVDKKEKDIEAKGNGKIVDFSFISLVIFAILFTYIIGMTQHFAGYGETIGMTLRASGFMISAVMFGNFVFKILKGILIDKIGAVNTTYATIGISLSGILILMFSSSTWSALFAAFLFGSGFGIGSIALPSLANAFYGKEKAKIVYPKLNLFMLVGSATSNTLVGYVYDFTGSYESIFMIAALMQVVNVFLIALGYWYIKNRYSKLELAES